MPVKKKNVKAKSKKHAAKNPMPNPHLAGKGRGLGTGAGIRRKIETPEILWELFEEFKQWCKDNPMEKHVGWKGKGQKIPVYEYKRRALVFKAFEGWLCGRRIVYDLSHYERNDDYRPIISAIKNECSQDCLQGGMNGLYNSNLTARLEGLVDKSETDMKIDRKQVADLFPFKKKS